MRMCVCLPSNHCESVRPFATILGAEFLDHSGDSGARFVGEAECGESIAARWCCGCRGVNRIAGFGSCVAGMCVVDGGGVGSEWTPLISRRKWFESRRLSRRLEVFERIEIDGWSAVECWC